MLIGKVQNAPQPVASLASTTLKVAARYIGEKEATGQNDGPFVEGIQKWYAGNESEFSEPWCAMFFSFCKFTASQELGVESKMPKSDSSTDLFSWLKENSLVLDAPMENCLGLVRGDGGTPGKTHHHTFMVKSVDLENGFVSGIDGNSENQVEPSKHIIEDCDFGPIV